MRCTTSFLLGLVLLAAALGLSHGGPETVADAPLDVVLEGSTQVQRQGNDVYYVLSVPYPAEDTLAELKARFTKAGWATLDRDPLDPFGHGEHLGRWASVPGPPGQVIDVWIGWFQKDNNLANVMLQYRRPEGADTVPSTLQVAVRRITIDDL